MEQPYLNAEIAKQFPDASRKLKWYTGRVVEKVMIRRGSSKVPAWHVVYKDGDREDLEKHELLKALEDFKKRSGARHACASAPAAVPAKMPETPEGSRPGRSAASAEKTSTQTEPTPSPAVQPHVPPTEASKPRGTKKKQATAPAEAPQARADAAGPAAFAPQSPIQSQFEIDRARRLARNREQIEALGVTQAAQELRDSAPAPAPAQPRKPREAPPQPREASRRSGRIERLAPVQYSDAALDAELRAARTTERRAGGGGGGKGKGKGKRKREPKAVVEQTEEMYTSEDEANLGSFKEEWPLRSERGGWRPATEEEKRAENKTPGYSGGYVKRLIRDEDGSGEEGATCHQCRQKAAGVHTSCSECEGPRGVFCGDCLRQRYGENADEANANPEWRCPACRNICNCSNKSCLRISRGWGPTGSLWDKSQKRGFLSVAHMIILTKRQEQREAAAAAEGAGMAAAGGQKKQKKA